MNETNSRPKGERAPAGVDGRQAGRVERPALRGRVGQLELSLAPQAVQPVGGLVVGGIGDDRRHLAGIGIEGGRGRQALDRLGRNAVSVLIPCPAGEVVPGRAEQLCGFSHEKRFHQSPVHIFRKPVFSWHWRAQTRFSSQTK